MQGAKARTTQWPPTSSIRRRRRADSGGVGVAIDALEPATAKLEDAINNQLAQLLGNVSPGDVNQIRFAIPTADKNVNAYESDEKQCDIGDIYYAYTHTPSSQSDNDITAPPQLCPLASPPTPNPTLQSAIQADLNSLGVLTFPPDNAWCVACARRPAGVAYIDSNRHGPRRRRDLAGQDQRNTVDALHAGVGQ